MCDMKNDWVNRYATKAAVQEVLLFYCGVCLNLELTLLSSQFHCPSGKSPCYSTLLHAAIFPSEEFSLR